MFHELLLVLGTVVTQTTPAKATAVNLSQLTAPAAQPGQLVIIAPDRRVVVADLGPGLVLDTSGAVPLLRAIVTQPAPRLKLGVAPVRQADGSYKLPDAPLQLAVWRNGLRASLPGEFTLAGDTFRFAQDIPDEVVLCDYVY